VAGRERVRERERERLNDGWWSRGLWYAHNATVDILAADINVHTLHDVCQAIFRLSGQNLGMIGHFFWLGA